MIKKKTEIVSLLALSLVEGGTPRLEKKMVNGIYYHIILEVPQNWQQETFHSNWHPNKEILFHLLSKLSTSLLGVVFHAFQGASSVEDLKDPCTHMSTIPILAK